MGGTAHIVAGSTGAGKTTYALALAEREGAVRFGIDDWMTTLFWPDAVPGADFDWAIERVERCVTQMKAVMAPMVRAGTDAVVDIGFTTFAERAAFARWAAAEDVALRLHLIDLPAHIRWSRVERRNAERGATFAITVTREMFDGVEARWQVPDAREFARLNGVRVA